MYQTLASVAGAPQSALISESTASVVASVVLKVSLKPTSISTAFGYVSFAGGAASTGAAAARLPTSSSPTSMTRRFLIMRCPPEQDPPFADALSASKPDRPSWFLLPVAAASHPDERSRSVRQWFVKSNRFAVPGFSNLWSPEITLRVAAEPSALCTVAGDADGLDWR